MSNQERGVDAIAEMAALANISKVTIVAWRDLDDPEAGGSELHAHRIATAWAKAGIEVVMRTSMVAGQPTEIVRDGYTVIRRGGRYAVFAQVFMEGLRHRSKPGEALVETWNGMPFFSPVWYRGPRIVVLHHVHGPMWKMSLSRGLAWIGEAIEKVLAPPLYRSSEVVTLSASSKLEIVEQMHLPASRITVVPPGIEPRFIPGGITSVDPLVVAVGRLVPVKQFDRLIETLVDAKTSVPALRAIIVGEGYLRPELETLIRDSNAEEWISLPGRLDDNEVVALYQQATVVASASLREGWGMTLTEAAACGTPSVATDIAGHRDAVVKGVSGVLAAEGQPLVSALVSILSDPAERQRLSDGALSVAAGFSWDRTAEQAFGVLALVAQRHAVR